MKKEAVVNLIELIDDHDFRREITSDDLDRARAFLFAYTYLTKGRRGDNRPPALWGCA